MARAVGGKRGGGGGGVVVRVRGVLAGTVGGGGARERVARAEARGGPRFLAWSSIGRSSSKWWRRRCL